MKNLKKALCLLLAVLMTVSLLAGCGSKKDDSGKKVFIQGIDAEYPPFSYLDSDGNYAGFDVEVCKAACDLLGWEYKAFPVNWEQKLVQLDRKECDCIWSGMTILDSMKTSGYTLSAPYYDNTQVIMVKEGSAVKSSKDLAGQTVAVQLGTSGESLLNEGGDLESLGRHLQSPWSAATASSECFTELGGGAVDAVIVDKPVADLLCCQGPTPASPSSARSWAPSSTASPSAPATRSCARPSRAPSRPWWTTAPTPRSPPSIPTSAPTTCCS